MVTYLPNKTCLAAKHKVSWVRGLGLAVCVCQQLGAAVHLQRNSLDLVWAGAELESGQE